MAPRDDPSHPVLPGDEISGYRIESELGWGAASVVYKATDLRTGRPVALKTPRVAEPPAEAGPAPVPGLVDRRLLRELRMLVRLAHPHIVAMLGAFEHGGVPWLVMELVEGESLRRRLRREGRLDPELACRYAADLAGAVHFAHTKGVLHQDVSPNNILVSVEGDVKLTDFGFARLADRRRRGAFVERVGTPAFMSPEQIRGEPLDGRSDVFSLGTVLYEMATGRDAFPGTDQAQVFESILHGAPDASAWQDDRVSRGLRAIVARAHGKLPGERYATAGEMEADLRALLGSA